jgi:DNA-directed RNA polymerase subunit delta
MHTQATGGCGGSSCSGGCGTGATGGRSACSCPQCSGGRGGLAYVTRPEFEDDAWDADSGEALELDAELDHDELDEADEFDDDEFDDGEFDDDDEFDDDEFDDDEFDDDEFDDDEFDDDEFDDDEFDDDEFDDFALDLDSLALDFREPRFRVGRCRFSSKEKSQLRAAIRIAEQMAAIGLSRMEDVNDAASGKLRISKRRDAWRSAWKSIGYVKKSQWTKSPAEIWFGKWSRRRMKRIVRTLRSIRRILSNRRLILRPGSPALKKNVGKYLAKAILKVGRRRIWIREAFFNKELHCQALTIVHELAHSVKWIRDKAYHINALKLSPRRAVQNADSYAYFCLSQYYLSLGKGESDVGHFLKGPTRC